MIEYDDYFCQVPDLTLSKEEQKSLLDLALQLDYDPYKKEIDSSPDNNYIQLIDSLPDWFVKKAKRFLDIGHPMFLKNKGNVPWHTDDKRMCSITVPLTHSNTPTSFKHLDEHLAIGNKRFLNPEAEIQLHHEHNTFLQNNQRYHLVRPDGEWRIFLQISFDKPYSEIRKMI